MIFKNLCYLTVFITIVTSILRLYLFRVNRYQWHTTKYKYFGDFMYHKTKSFKWYIRRRSYFYNSKLYTVVILLINITLIVLSLILFIAVLFIAESEYGVWLGISI